MAETVAIVLAAGKGLRLGGPKALLMWPGPKGTKPRPLAIAHAEARLGAESKRVIVVARKQVVKALIPYVRPGLDLLVSNELDELGPAGSIAVAAARLQPDDRAVVCPVDTLPARAETVRKLLDALGSSEVQAVAARPRHGGRFGHPVVLVASALERYKQPNPPPLRDFVQTLGERAAAVDVVDPDVLVDINTPAEAVRYLHAPPTFLSS